MNENKYKVKYEIELMFVYLFVKMCTINLFFFSPAIKLWKTMSFGEERRLSAINGQQGENILLCLRRITIPYLLKKTGKSSEQ